ncbi:MAG: hypothetical protein JST65_21035 [Acidobacteria bacterium]|nr:hypothetical protein [Acidobacteriota bacterium]
MLRIREAQLAAFGSAATRQFAEELREFLEVHFPQSCCALGGDAEFTAFVQRAIHEARALGVESANGVQALATVWLQFGFRFERSPLKEWARNILAHPSLPGEAKALSIFERHEAETQGSILIAF